MGDIFLNSIGLMTGTSADGADLCLVKYRINRKQKIISEKVTITGSFPIDSKLQKKIRAAQAGKIPLKEYGALTLEYSLWLEKNIESFIRKNKISKKNLILGIHGQTLWHAPPTGKNKKPGFSIQMIDGSVISQKTGVLTVSQFRQPDLVFGGQGAPLVPYIHYLIATSGTLKTKPPLVIHNLGGISNLTYVGPKKEIIAFDTGPANALIDAAVRKITKGKKAYDHGGAIAKLGAYDLKEIKKIANHKYFLQKPPKSTGKELFNDSFLKNFKTAPKDLVAQVTAFTAYTIAKAYADFLKGKKIKALYMTGGGAKNPYLIKLIMKFLKEEFKKEYKLEVMPDHFGGEQYLESFAFARLAVEALLGHSVSLKQVTGAKKEGTGCVLYQAENYTKLIKDLGAIF